MTDRKTGQRLVFRLEPDFVKRFLDLPYEKQPSAGREVAEMPEPRIFSRSLLTVLLQLGGKTTSMVSVPSNVRRAIMIASKPKAIILYKKIVDRDRHILRSPRFRLLELDSSATTDLETATQLGGDGDTAAEPRTTKQESAFITETSGS